MSLTWGLGAMRTNMTKDAVERIESLFEARLGQQEMK